MSFDAPDRDLFDDEPSTSIFASVWFRALVVIVALGGLAIVATPYLLDRVRPNPLPPRSAVRPATTPAPARAAGTSVTGPSTKPVTPSPSTAATVTPASSARSAPAVSAGIPLPTRVGSAPTGVTPPVTAGTSTDDQRPAAASAPTAKPSMPSTASATSPASSVPPASGAAPMAVAAPPAAPATSPARAPDARDTSAARAAAMDEQPAERKGGDERPTPSATAAVAESGGDYWVQVGAFTEPEGARRLATRLRDLNFSVDESIKRVRLGSLAGGTPPAGADRYDVVISEPSAAEISPRLAAKGLAAEPTAAGAVVKPSLPLKDAVTLSRDLAAEGLKVQVRRAAAGAAPLADIGPDGGAIMYRVRVGAFADRGSAVAALHALEARGYRPFLTRDQE
jgi:hypothetical protein